MDPRKPRLYGLVAAALRDAVLVLASFLIPMWLVFGAIFAWGVTLTALSAPGELVTHVGVIACSALTACMLGPLCYVLAWRDRKSTVNCRGFALAAASAATGAPVLLGVLLGSS